VELLSLSYLLFFVAVAVVYWLLPTARARRTLLVAATLFWFLLGVWWHALAAIAMATTGWLTARWIASRPEEERGVPTLVGIALPVLWFVLFRYAAPWTGHEPAEWSTLPWWLPNPLLAPLGLSFIMFETIAIQVDLYWSKLDRPGRWWSHVEFALYFPTRVIGPMRSYQDFTEQLATRIPVTGADVAAGVGRIAIGLVKKVMIANPVGTFALFNLRPEMIEGGAGIPLLLGLYAYWVFLYFDFSGYSDIVIGLSRLLGIRIQENFASPWLATNISEYWQRWHMSLSGWVREYIFQPAAIAWRNHRLGAPAGAFLSMVVLGLWHGIELRYVAFGAFHGLLLAGYMLYREAQRGRPWLKGFSRSRAASVLGWGVTLNLAVWSHVFYATPSFDAALRLVAAIGRAFGIG
jgi:alginate O-acetyltransferase complex protein AlgI